MERVVDVKISGTRLSKETNRAGVQGEANVTHMRLSFDESWKGFAKKITFWNARGKNPVTIPLTADMLENIAVSTCTYLCLIPGEAMTEGGKMKFILDGYMEGKRKRSISDELDVIPAPMTEGTDAQDPTPSEAERLQAQIDGILDVIANEVTGASAHAANAAVSEGNAAGYAQQAKASADSAKVSETAAAGHAAAAQAAANAASSGVVPSLEIMPVRGGGYVDFHYDGAQNDFTSRIAESERGVLDVFGTLREYGHRVYSPGNKPTPAELGVFTEGTLTAVNFNAAYEGVFRCRECTNGPHGSSLGILICKAYDGNYAYQLFHAYQHKKTYQRYCDGAVWSPWEEIYTSRNLVELRDALKAIW